MSSVRVSVLPWRVSVTVRQPCCHDVLLIPTSSARPFVSRNAGPPESPLQVSTSPVSANVVGVDDATDMVAVCSQSGTHSLLVRPYPATRRLSPFAAAVVPSAIGVTSVISVSSFASTTPRSARVTRFVTFTT